MNAAGPDENQKCLDVDDALAFCTGAGASPDLVRTHIGTCDRCRIVVAEAARSLEESRATEVGVFRVLADGVTVAERYRIVRFIARGGMGEVYEAFDTALGESVALKTLSVTGGDDSHAISRVGAEVRLARRVTHPNVCRIFDFGLHQTGVGPLPFFTMQLLRGETLGQKMARDGRLSEQQLRRMVEEVVEGLAAIHASGIVHRDLKVDNIFLAEADGHEPRAVLMDFGLARAPSETSGSMLSSPSSVAGTVDYMPPEVLSGGTPTPAADIYALGVVVFELLTGQKPFVGGSPIERAVSRMRDRAPAPSTLIRTLSTAWDPWVGGCLERDPKRRFAGLADLPPIPAMTTDTKRRQVSRALALGVVSSVVLIGVASFVTVSRISRRRQAMVVPKDPVVETVKRPALVEPQSKSALLGRPWPKREIEVCIVPAPGDSVPFEARSFEFRAYAQLTFGTWTDLWFDSGSNWARCEKNPRPGAIMLSLVKGKEHRADLGYNEAAPVRVEVGIDDEVLIQKLVNALGRALGFAMKGGRYPTPEEMMLFRKTYGRKPPGSLVGGWGRCVTTRPDSPRVELSRCTGDPSDVWSTREGRLQNNEGTTRCLAKYPGNRWENPAGYTDCQTPERDQIRFQGVTWRGLGDRCVVASEVREKAEVHVTDCSYDARERWDFFDGDRVKLSGTNLCLTAPPDTLEIGKGARLNLIKCGDPKAGFQDFKPLPGGVLSLAAHPNFCVVAFEWNQSGSAGELGLWTECHLSRTLPSQYFNLKGSIHAGDRCLAQRGDLAQDSKVWFGPCLVGRSSQNWEYHW